MEKCTYSTVETDLPEKEDSVDSVPRKYLLRQVYVCTGVWACYFSFGIIFGAPTVLIAQKRREANSTDAVSIEMASWISSTYNYSGAVCTIILTSLARWIGRKRSFVFVGITSLIGFVVFYFSTTFTQLLISEVIHGPMTACQVTVSLMIITEYTSARYRGLFLTLKSASFFWGIWVANAIGTFMHWKNIGIVAFVCSSYSLLTTLFLPESPYWLASKDKLDECVAAHRWLKGSSKEAKAEEDKLLESRKSYTPSTSHGSIRRIVNILSSETFSKPIKLIVMLFLLYNFSGKIACGMYSIDIIKRITNTESTAYAGMLILDGVTILGMYVGCGFSKILKRRTILLVFSSIGLIFLFGISTYLYLIHFGIILENTYISLTLLIGYSLAVSMGPMIMCTTIVGELIPVKYRSAVILAISIFSQVIMGMILKISPYLFNYFGTRGLFLFFAVHELVCIIVVYKILPETKDKTLLEIQESLLGSKSNDN